MEVNESVLIVNDEVVCDGDGDDGYRWCLNGENDDGHGVRARTAPTSRSSIHRSWDGAIPMRAMLRRLRLDRIEWWRWMGGGWKWNSIHSSKRRCRW